MKNKLFVATLLAFALPFLANAQDVSTLISKIRLWTGNLAPIMVGIALLFFVWNLTKLIRSESEEDRKEAKMNMWWGIFAMFVIISIWGIVQFIGATLGVDTNKTNIDYPHPPS